MAQVRGFEIVAKRREATARIGYLPADVRRDSHVTAAESP